MALLFEEAVVLSFIIPGSQPLGVGKYGEVFRGAIPAVGGPEQLVAIKISKNNDTVTREQFQNEIQWLTHPDIHHQNLIQYFGHCQTEEKIYILVEFAKGGDLLNSLEGLKWEETMIILKGIAAGIFHLHSRHIRIGDLKTANILLTEEKKPKIADFGTMKYMAQNQNPNSPPEAIICTHGFMDPRIDLRAYQEELSDDVYAFGVIMLQLLTKREVNVGHIHLSETARREFEEGKIIVHDRLRTTGCRERDATALTRLALELTDARNVSETEDYSQLLRIPIEEVIPRLDGVQVVQRNFFKQTKLRIGLMKKKIKWKISKN